MKKIIKRLHRSNDGYTLMELIVTMLVSSIVTAAVAGFLSMGLQYYRRTNAETALQTESQVAELFLTELLQESQEYQTINGVGDLPDGVSYALEVTRDSAPYIVARKGEFLVYGAGDTSITDQKARIKDVTDKGLDQVFLARYVDKFEVITHSNGLIRLVLEFKTDGKSYTGTQTISLRNKEKN